MIYLYLGKSTWGTLNKRSDETTYEVRHLLEGTRDHVVPFEKELKSIYEACLNEDEINSRGAEPATKWIKENFGGWSWQRDTNLRFQVNL